MTESAPTEAQTAPQLAPAAQLPVLHADPAAVATIRNEIQIGDRARISTYGDRAQRSVTSYADRILAQTQNRELGETGRLLTNIILKAKQLDPAALENKGFFEKLFGDVRSRFEEFRAKFDDVAGQIDAIGIEVDRRRETLRTDIAMLDDLHEETKGSIIDLDAFIEAGKAFADNYRATELPKIKATADAAASAGAGQGMMEAQAYQDAVQALDRLDKRVFYLQQARQVGIQQLPQIRIVQSSDESLMEQLQATTRLTIPLWKQKMVLLLGLTRQKEALDLQKTVTDATNEMLRQTSEMMKGQATQIEQQAQRGLIDIETLEQTNADLIATIQGVAQIQEEGRAKRAQVETRMQQLSEELRQGLLNTKFER